MGDPNAIAKVNFYPYACSGDVPEHQPEFHGRQTMRMAWWECAWDYLPGDVRTFTSDIDQKFKFLNIIQAFQEHYYNTFSSNRQALAGLYKEDAFLTFEGQTVQGNQAITQKLTALPFQQVCWAA